MSLVITPQAIATALDLSTSQTDLNVASVKEQSNSKTGYKLKVTSANLGKLKRADGADVFSYSMKYNGSVVALSTTTGVTLLSSSAAAISTSKSVSISYTGVPQESMVEGIYTDTLTFTIAAN